MVLKTSAPVILFNVLIISRLVFNSELKHLRWLIHFTFSFFRIVEKDNVCYSEHQIDKAVKKGKFSVKETT
jgi:hypothetical protein